MFPTFISFHFSPAILESLICIAVPNKPQPTKPLTKPEVSPSFNFLKKLLVKVPSVLQEIAAIGMSATALAAPVKVVNGEYSYKNFKELTKNLGNGTTRESVNGTLFIKSTNDLLIPV